jgi:hypothetical protein
MADYYKRGGEIMFINFTNHPSANWSPEQIAAADEYGEIIDIPFPEVDPDGDEGYITRLAERYAGGISLRKPKAVLCQGEMTLAFAVAGLLLSMNVTVLAACSKRVVKEAIGENGKAIKIAAFTFTRFRKYFHGFNLRPKSADI